MLSVTTRWWSAASPKVEAMHDSSTSIAPFRHRGRAPGAATVIM